MLFPEGQYIRQVLFVLLAGVQQYIDNSQCVNTDTRYKHACLEVLWFLFEACDNSVGIP